MFIVSLFIDLILMADLVSRIFVTITTDDADCIVPDTSITDNTVDDQDDACGVFVDTPTIVVSSTAVSKGVPVFRPFVPGAGYC